MIGRLLNAERFISLAPITLVFSESLALIRVMYSRDVYVYDLCTIIAEFSQQFLDMHDSAQAFTGPHVKDLTLLSNCVSTELSLGEVLPFKFQKVRDEDKAVLHFTFGDDGSHKAHCRTCSLLCHGATVSVGDHLQNQSQEKHFKAFE